MADTVDDTNSIQDLGVDAQVFAEILKDCVHKLSHSKTHKNTPVTVLASITAMVRDAQQEVHAFSHDIREAKTEEHLQSLYEKKRALIDTLHALMGYTGQAVVASHWQSPAIDQSVVDEVGNIHGKIIAHYNDYTRDQHVMGSAYEATYRNEYIHIPRTMPVYAYATSSGMAALTTAALMILGETPRNTNILLGASCYFETKQVLKKMFSDRLHVIDLSDTKAMSCAVRELSPVAVFADVIGNEPDMRIVDSPMLVREMSLSRAAKKFVVVDTSASAYMRPLFRGLMIPRGVMVVGVESQNKLLQFGFDRVTAGVVWGTGFEAMKLYDYRDHAGTMCPDMSLCTLPTPNARLASMHIRRLERNTKILVDILKKDTRVVSKKIHVTYPDETGFNGVYCMLTWKERPLSTFDGYIRKVMRKAKQLDIPIVHGTSFGFHTTRIYTVAMHTEYERPFLRISPGTEVKEQMIEIGNLICGSL